MLQPPRKIAVLGFLVLSLIASSTSWLLQGVRADRPDAAEPKTDARPAVDRHGFPLPPGAAARLGGLAFRHEGRITALACSPDGKTIASGEHTGVIHLWDMNTGREIRQYREHLNPVTLLVFSPDGKHLASGEFADLPPLTADAGRRGGVLVALADNGPVALAEQATPEEADKQNGQVILRELAGGKVLRRVVGPTDQPAGRPIACFSPDGSVLATRGTEVNTVQLWESATGNLRVTLSRLPHALQAVAFLANGATVVTAGIPQDPTAPPMDNDTPIPPGGVALWDAATGRQKRVFAQPDQGEGNGAVIAFAPDARTFVLVPTGGNLQVWESSTGKMRRQIKRKGPLDAAPSLVFSPEGKHLAMEAADHKVRIWNLVTDQLVQTFRTTPAPRKLAGPDLGPSAPVAGCPFAFPAELPVFSALAFTSDGKALAVGGPDHTIRFWDLTTGQERVPTTGHRQGVASVAFAPDGKVIATGGADRTIRFWDPVTQQELRQLRGHTGPVTFLAFAPDGKLLASGSPEEDVIRLWDTAEGKELRQFPTSGLPDGWKPVARYPDSDYKLHAAFTPDGQTLLTREHRLDDKSLSGVVTFWDVQTGKERKKVTVYTNTFPAVDAAKPAAAANPLAADPMPKLGDIVLPENFAFALSADGKVLATTSATSITLWDTATDKSLRTFTTTNDGPLSFVVFAPDGKTLAAVGIRSLPNHRGGPLPGPFPPVQPMPGAASPEESAGTVITLYDVANGDELHELEGHDGLITAVAFVADSKRLASVSYDKTLRLWDVASGKQLRSAHGHLGQVLSVAFSADAAALATGSSDATVLLWKTADVLRPDTASAGLKEMDSLWTDLASVDAGRAAKAMRELGTNAAAVKLLEQRMQPMKVDAALAKRMEGWIGELESDKFPVREKAAAQLEKCGELAEGALQKALAGMPALESKQRIEQILKKIEDGMQSGDHARALRAIEVLEQIGTPEARRLLETLATGAAEVQLTQEARAAFQRLGRRTAP